MFYFGLKVILSFHCVPVPPGCPYGEATTPSVDWTFLDEIHLIDDGAGVPELDVLVTSTVCSPILANLRTALSLLELSVECC